MRLPLIHSIFSRYVLLAGSLLLLMPPVNAAEVQFSGVSAFGGLYTSRVVSLHEAKYRNLVRQKTDYSCGAAALATILKYAYDIDADENIVMEGMLKVGNAEVIRKKGFSMLDMKRFVESLGMRGRGYRLSEQRLKKLKIPVIVLMNINGYKHFSVLKRISNGEAFLADPVLGNKRMTFDAFKKAWSNRVVFAVIGSGFVKDTVLLETPYRLSSQQWREKISPLLDSELMDFGFTHADLF